MIQVTAGQVTDTMDIDWIKNAVDDEVVYHSSCLRQTSPEAATSDPCRPPPP